MEHGVEVQLCRLFASAFCFMLIGHLLVEALPSLVYTTLCIVLSSVSVCFISVLKNKFIHSFIPCVHVSLTDDFASEHQQCVTVAQNLTGSQLGLPCETETE